MFTLSEIGHAIADNFQTGFNTGENIGGGVVSGVNKITTGIQQVGDAFSEPDTKTSPVQMSSFFGQNNLLPVLIFAGIIFIIVAANE